MHMNCCGIDIDVNEYQQHIDTHKPFDKSVELRPLGSIWHKYGFKEYGVRLNNEKTGRKVIYRDDEYISDVTEAYYLLPNEEVVMLAAETAKLVGLEPYPIKQPRNRVLNMEGNAIYGKNKRQIHCLFRLPEDFEVGNRTLILGIGVHNSIDGSMGFGMGTFSFRLACSNMVWAGFKQGQFARGLDQQGLATHLYHKHTKGLSADYSKLQEKMMELITNSKQIIDFYRAMERVSLNQDIAQQLVDRIPQKYLPDYIQVDDDLTAAISDKPSLWQCYNDFTEVMWHDAAGDFGTTRTLNDTLHKVMVQVIRQ